MDRTVYVAYRMAQLLVTLNDLEGHFCYLKVEPFLIPMFR